METYKCLECGNDLTDGVTLFTKSNVFNENMRYIYCSECGKVHLFNLSNGSIKNVDLSNEDIEKCDKQDKTRKFAPLVICEDAVVIDTSFLNVEEVVEKIIDIVCK